MKIISSILTIALFLVFVVLIVRVANISDRDCLKEIAEDYCEDNDMSLYKVGYRLVSGGVFMCREDERSLGFKVYRFLEDEIEECKNK